MQKTDGSSVFLFNVQVRLFILVSLQKNNLIFIIKDLLVKTLQEATSPAEAPAGAPFGKYLFAPERNDLDPDAQQEQNTVKEQEFFDALSEHYNGSPEALALIAKKIISMSNKGWYSKILAPPNTLVYRFISDISTENAAKIVGSTVGELSGFPIDDDDMKEFKKYEDYSLLTNVTYHGQGTMKPGGDMSGVFGTHSWSTKLGMRWIIRDLGTIPLYPNESSILLTAETTSENFFIDPAGIAEVGDLPEFASYQNEVISYGPVEYDHAYVITNKTKEHTIPDDVYIERLLRTIE